ncbi:hypothetical protein [Actinophytocola sp. KF-1]
MPYNSERSAVMLGFVVLFVLAVFTMAVPVVGYILLALVILAGLALVGGFVAMWWQTRWQPLDDRHRPARPAASVTASSEREVA